MDEHGIDRNEFYDQAMGQAMPDEMAFQLNRGPKLPDDRAFSAEAYETLAYQMHDFMLARTVAFMQREGRPPNGMRVEMRIRWDEESTAEELAQTEWMPWYAAQDAGSGRLITADGERRALPFLRERREEVERRRTTR